jgi:hypothetical protein
MQEKIEKITLRKCPNLVWILIKSSVFKVRNEECQKERINPRFAAVCVCTVFANVWQRLTDAQFSSAAACAVAAN